MNETWETDLGFGIFKKTLVIENVKNLEQAFIAAKVECENLSDKDFLREIAIADWQGTGMPKILEIRKNGKITWNRLGGSYCC